MPKFTVTYPICGSVTVAAEASDAEEAVELGWDLTSESGAEMSWEAMEHIVEGNVFNGWTNKISVEEGW